jgi:hypothetical protein
VFFLKFENSYFLDVRLLNQYTLGNYGAMPGGCLEFPDNHQFVKYTLLKDVPDSSEMFFLLLLNNFAM